MLLQRTDGLHKRALEVVTDAHNLAGGLHLSGQCSFCGDKFIKRQPWQLYHHIVQRGLKAGKGLARNGVFNFVKGIAKGNLGRHLGNGVAGGLACQRRGTTDTGIHLNHTVFKAIGMKGKLHITPAGNLKLVDDIECRGTEHLVFLIPQRLGGRHHDAVPGMHPYGVDIFHVADGDAVACAIAHHLILDFLPARNTALHKNLPHSG